MRKILVTGAGGFVGARILDQWRGRYELCTFPHGFSANSDEAAVRALIAREKPDVIVHTAALSNTAYCASHPEESLRANVLLPEWIAKAAVETGTKLLAFSSDQVYSACEENGPYIEDVVKPGNIYAEHKLEMEQRVLDLVPSAVMLRAEWMYDYVSKKPNYFLNMIHAKQQAAFSSRQFRGITYLKEVVENMDHVMALPGGAYNFGSETTQSMYEITEQFLDLLGNQVAVQDAPPRHNLWMNCEKARKYGVEFSDVFDGLKRCLRDYERTNKTLREGNSNEK